MTNKQKALEISAKHKIDYRVYMKNHPVVVPSDSECFGSAMEMAEWKDQQLKDAINSTLDYFDRGREAGFVSENSYNDMKYFASKIINKLFGKE